MIEFTVEQSELTCQWRFKDSFIPIPAPGDEDFAVLFRSLSPFGATLSLITFEDGPQSFDEERMPYQYLKLLCQQRGSRLRLLPPYREHLAQAFARFFMRVGLPTPVNLDDK